LLGPIAARASILRIIPFVSTNTDAR
jgi:hypothetical protein